MTALRVVRLILVVGMALATLAAQTPSPYATFLSGQVLTSPYFGFSYSFPEQLVPNTGEMLRRLMKDGTPSSTTTVTLMFSAYEPPSRSKRRLGVMIDIRKAGASTAMTFAEKHELSLRTRGWTIERKPEKVSINGLDFYRVDYSHEGGYGSSICTVMKDYLLEFLLTAGSPEELQVLSNSLKNLRFERTAAR
jgi:hypothetical protein